VEPDCWPLLKFDLPAAEKTLLEFDPANRIVPTTITRIIGQRHGVVADILPVFIDPESA
jgi:hypothetical protein